MGALVMRDLHFHYPARPDVPWIGPPDGGWLGTRGFVSPSTSGGKEGRNESVNVM